MLKDGVTPVTIPACGPMSAATEIDHLSLNRLLLSGAPAYMISLAQDTSPTTKTSDPIPPEVQEVLEKYPDIFTEPACLPPKRECDHEIPLAPGTDPPNTRPYRVPHTQKEFWRK